MLSGTLEVTTTKIGGFYQRETLPTGALVGEMSVFGPGGKHRASRFAKGSGVLAMMLAERLPEILTSDLPFGGQIMRKLGQVRNCADHQLVSTLLCLPISGTALRLPYCRRRSETACAGFALSVL